MFFNIILNSEHLSKYNYAKFGSFEFVAIVYFRTIKEILRLNYLRFACSMGSEAWTYHRLNRLDQN